MMEPATLPRHELTGLEVCVRDASDPTLVGRSGQVVDETRNTLLISARDGSEIQVPKPITTFEFRTPDGTAVAVDGSRLVARPARRTERRGESVWR